MGDIAFEGLGGAGFPGTIFLNAATRTAARGMHQLHLCAHPLKTLTSSDKEVRLFFSLRDNSIWRFPSPLPVATTAFGGPEGYFSLAIIAFGAVVFIVPKIQYRIGKMEIKESRLLI